MNIKTILESIHESVELSTPKELAKACKLIVLAQEMKANERDTFICAFLHGPLFDGDVPSKSGRDALLADGFIAKVVVKGNDGYNACTYKGRNLYNILNALRVP